MVELRKFIPNLKVGLESLAWYRNRKVLVVCNPFLTRTALLNDIVNRIGSQTIEIYSHVRPQSPLVTVIEGSLLIKRWQPDVLVVVGDRSAISTGRAMRYFYEQQQDTDQLHVILVPTVNNNGFEATRKFVINSGERGKTITYSDPRCDSDDLLIHPNEPDEPSKIIEKTAAFEQLSYGLEILASAAANPTTDLLATNVVKLSFQQLTTNEVAASNAILPLISALTGNAMNRTGLGICYTFAERLNALFHVPFGVTCAMMIEHVMIFNNARCPILVQKYQAVLAQPNVMCINPSHNLPTTIAKLRQQLDFPNTLSEFGLEKNDVLHAAPGMLQSIQSTLAHQNIPAMPTYQELNQFLMKILN